MDFDLTDDQEELRQAVRRALDANATEARRRATYESEYGVDETLWKTLAESMGLTGLLVGVRPGEAEPGLVELTVVMAELGRHVVSVPYLATVALAGSAIAACPESPERTRLLDAISVGSSTAALAYADAEPTEASPADCGWTLSGTKKLVVDAQVADVLIVTAQTTVGTALFSVDPHQAGVTNTQTATMDPTRRLCRVILDGATAVPLAGAERATQILDSTLDIARVAVAAESLGGAQRCLEMSVDYAKTREQFGHPIGSFQAVKHHCADMLLQVQSAKAALDFAAWAHHGQPEEFPVLAAVAASVVDDAYLDVAKRTIQVHGGMGFTWEHQAHFYFKRAKSTSLLFGSAHLQREVLADRLGL